MPGITNTERTLGATLDRLVRLVDGSQGGPVVPRELRERGRARAFELVEAAATTDGARSLATVAFAAEMFGAIAVDLAAHPPDAKRLIEQFEEISGIGRVALARDALRWPQLMELAPDVALEVQLALLLAFTDATAVSVWTQWPTGALKRICQSGEQSPDDARERDVAIALVRAPAPDTLLVDALAGVRLDRWQHEPAALIARGVPQRRDNRLLLLEAGAATIGAILDRRMLLESGGGPSDQTVLTAVERRLARLRFDLHDGPQQDVHLLASDLALFREQLLPIVADDPNYERIVGRLDDLAAQLVALDGDLRRLSSAVQSPFLPPGSLRESLRELTEAFTTRTGIEPQSELTGDFSGLSESQQITLLALIREALTNVREHSDARQVTIAVTSGDHGVEAKVIDDGRGFDPETTLLRAAREGHLGLVGMYERVRMLGGRTQIESRPGGPTVISVSLPAWPGRPDPG